MNTKPYGIRERDSEIQRPFDLWAECYEDGRNPLLCLEDRSLVDLLPNLKGLAVADLGCGAGRWFSRMEAAGARCCVGIDLSSPMLKQASQKAGLQTHLVQADLLQMPLHTAAIDFILCSFTLGYLEALDSFCDGINRALRPGGRIICTDLHPATHRLGWKRAFKRQGQRIEIESVWRSVEQISLSFERHFLRVSQREFYLGEPERVILELAGKPDVFEQARDVPVVLFQEWRKQPRASDLSEPPAVPGG